MARNAHDPLHVTQRAVNHSVAPSAMQVIPEQPAIATLGDAGRARRRIVSKAVAYVIHESRLLVFAHNTVPMEITRVQVPAGTVEAGESSADAVLREVREETGLEARIVRPLGVERYDMWPSKAEIHERHFFHLVPNEVDVSTRWTAGEMHPSDGSPAQAWTCWWMPLEQAHVLCAGLGARLGELDDSPRPPPTQR